MYICVNGIAFLKGLGSKILGDFSGRRFKRSNVQTLDFKGYRLLRKKRNIVLYSSNLLFYIKLFHSEFCDLEKGSDKILVAFEVLAKASCK